MSGFSAEWLALREPADHAARNAAVRAAAMQHLHGRDHVRVLDLACGTGANLRGLAPYLPARQSWRLVDNDPALLAAARQALSRWANASRDSGDRLRLVKDNRVIEVSFETADLVKDVAQVLSAPTDLVTSSAFFDLVSRSWMSTFCADLAQRRLPLYAILTYTGVEDWTPPHPLDQAVLKAFLRHQATDKGFGIASGPRAAKGLTKALAAEGYDVVTGESDWRLDEGQSPLIASLARGIAQAVAEKGTVPAEDVAAWRAARERAESCRIGHLDHFAKPKD